MSQTPASDLLRADHRLVEAQIDPLLEAAKHPGADFLAQVRRALSSIQELSRSHFQKEEEVLYPFLRPRWPDLLAQLDEQHDYAREVERHLEELLASLSGLPDERQTAELVRFSIELCDVLQHHIVEEEDQLLRLADEHLSQAEQAALASRMKQLQEVSAFHSDLERSDGEQSL